MNTFHLYSKLLRKTQSNVISTTIECIHTSIIVEHGISTCSDCGIEITNTTENQNTNVDINRYYIRKNTEKSLYNDIKQLDIPDKIKDTANEIFMEVCEKRTKRSTKRKSIVFGVIYHAFKLNNNPQTFQSLQPLFNITRREASEGLKFINEHIAKDSPLRTIYITPEDIIREFMLKFNATKEQLEEVIGIYRSVKGKSCILNRSKPQSVAAGVIYYYILQNNKKIPIKEFIKKVNMSELTIHKISREVEEVIKIEK